ncbi:hypothetical protein THAOC_12305 [Thalassiosira oceanica]|uniref:Uncharacterized protein n=1 Tax=Thalassiosira oceanica TaxID=159749 RepID=K0T0F4_THAOC|nr:hypothetical protein THAOC_12305 [Thalassiosira oceanica]|eukprot:EJK66741.1 hypothetical protein THAOC_12305 [Thalassiosira oceanica]
MTKHQSFFEQPGGQGSDQGRRDTDDGQIRKVVTVTRCDKGAVLTLNGRSTTSEINNRVLAATSFATSKADKDSQPHIKESLLTGQPVLPDGCTPRYTAVPKKKNETAEQKSRREDKQTDWDHEEDLRARKNLDQYNAQALLVFQALGSLLTPEAEQAMKNQGEKWEAMKKAKGTRRILKFIKLYKEVANPTETKAGASMLHSMRLIKHALGTNQDELNLQSGAQLGEEVRQRLEAARDAGVRVVVDRIETAYMTRKLLTWNNPTNQEQTAGYSRITADQITEMREQTQQEVEGLVFTTSLSEHGVEGDFVDALNNKANLSGDDYLEGKTLVDLVGMLSRHSGSKPKPKVAAKQGEKVVADDRLALTTAGEKDEKGGKITCIESDTVCRIAPDTKGRLWLDSTNKLFRCSNKACKDAKKDLGHGIKNCPNKENKEEDATTDDGLALATVSHSNQAIKQVLFGGATVGGGTATGFGLTTAGGGNPSPDSSRARAFGGGKAGVGHAGRKAGVGPVSAVSAHAAPPTGPQECVGQDDATGLGQASKSPTSPFA